MFDLHKEVKENAIQKKKKKCREKNFIAIIKKNVVMFLDFCDVSVALFIRYSKFIIHCDCFSYSTYIFLSVPNMVLFFIKVIAPPPIK